MSAPQNQVFINGQQSAVTGDQLNTFVQWVTNVAELRNFIGVSFMNVYLEGYIAPGDGGQGNFYWNASGTGPDDGGVTNVVPFGAAVGCWTRIGTTGGGGSAGVVLVSTARGVALADNETLFVATAAVTLTLTRTILLTNGFYFETDAQGGAITLTPNASDVIEVNGVALAAGVSFTIPLGASAKVYTGATGFWYLNYLGPRLNAEATIASGATTDLGSAASNVVSITGTTTITSFGSSASIGNPLYELRFIGALVLTYNSTSMILPGGANITTAPGDTAWAKYEGSGNWRIISYSRAIGELSTIGNQIFLTSGTYTPSSGMRWCTVEIVGGGGGGSSSHPGGGGGAGEYARQIFGATTIGASQSITIGAGGAVSTGGGTTSFGSLITAVGGAAASTLTGGIGGTGGTGSAVRAAGGNGSSAAASSFVWGAAGGNSYFGGGGGGGGENIAATAGQTNSGGGGGGGGAASGNGGVGGSGLCIITEYGL